MCGILGHLAFDPEYKIPDDKLSHLNDLMFHRGPNSAGIDADGPIALAMRRLAIIDISGGSQPMRSHDNRYIIVFNGEIYNYEDLRKDLLQKGYPIKTLSDTEVLLYSYIDAGPECLSCLNGMFAFAVWDTLNKTLFIARDRLGVKPLYYTYDDKRFFFSSELTPLQKSGLFDLEIDPRSVVDLMAYWYVCDPKTIFENVFQIPPGHYLIVEDAVPRIHRWWAIPASAERDIGFNDACEEYKNLFHDAVRLRLRSDVPVGTFLSGGIDSGLVTHEAALALPSPITCFSFDFKEKTYSEMTLARQTAAQVSAELIRVVMEDVTPDLIDQILLAQDEPFGNASYIPTYLLFKAAKGTCPVILTGDGSDELLGGYPTYQAPYYQRMYELFPKRFWAGVASIVETSPVSHNRISFDYKLRQFLRGAALSPERAHASWREILGLDEQLGVLRSEVSDCLSGYDPFENFQSSFCESQNLELQNRFMHADLTTYLRSDHLRKIDRMSMAHSVEARQPFLDYRIVEFSMSLPAKHKVSFRSTKRLLRNVARPILPRAVVRGGKKGLTSPIAHWISNELRAYVGDRLQGGLVEKYFAPAAVQRIFSDHLAGRRDYSRLIWSLLSFQVWGQKMGQNR